MKTFLLIMTVIVGPDPEADPAHDYVMDYDLTLEECVARLEAYAPLYIGNAWVGMHCEEGL